MTAAGADARGGRRPITTTSGDGMRRARRRRVLVGIAVIGALAVGGVAAAGGFRDTTATPRHTAPRHSAPPVRRTIPSPPTGPPAALDSVACPSVSECIAVGGAGGVRVSRTGGRSWTAVAAPTHHFLYGVACPDPAHCVAVGDAGTVLSTDDAGTRWTMVRTGVDRPLSSVACTGSGRCYAVGDGDTVLVTDDSGNRWHVVSSGFGVLDGVACSAVVHCAAVTSSAVTDLTTTDGTVWGPTTVPFSALDSLSPLNGIACSGPTCLGVGGRGLLAWSDDGGTEWFPGQPETSEDLQAAACSSPEQCVVVGLAGTILSTGGPGSQAVPDLSPTTEALLGVTCSRAEECVAVGSGGTILTSADGGARWVVRAGRPAPTPGVRLLVVGDSFAHTLALGLARNASAYGVTLIDGSLDGCAIARGSPVLVGGRSYPITGPCATAGPGWPAQYRADVATDQPTLSLLVLGPWDLSTRFIDGQWSWPGQPYYDAYYRRQVVTALQILTAAGGRVALTTVPEVRTSGPQRCQPLPATTTGCPTETARVEALNSVARQAVRQFPGRVAVIDLGRRLSPGGTFVSEVDGVVVRAADGVHVSEPGGEWLTPWLIPQLVATAR
jgi:photosystem II stability/assembly factor-like uncharacterized protein